MANGHVVECACSAKVLQAYALFEMKQGIIWFWHGCNWLQLCRVDRASFFKIVGCWSFVFCLSEVEVQPLNLLTVTTTEDDIHIHTNASFYQAFYLLIMRSTQILGFLLID
jgi:hypothetical protein